ncbi:toxin-antitoxin system YwqK family antitoxin [Ferruginibacter sp. SUN106]|uniref:toxin-antitoxin system YwqK family antitoxin n=1 Tax=Ferruginibacter sp. SUN106 TaxID=2978348 RepID=UPI003D36872E
MKLLFLFVFSYCTMMCYGQKTDTTWWVKYQRIQTITQTKGNTANIKCWHANGQPMCDLVIALTTGYVPQSNVVILDSTGKKVQEYIARKGWLINYMPSGKIKDILRAAIKDTAQRYTEYYTNGRIKTKSFARKDSGKNSIYFFLPNFRGTPIAYMYQQESYTPWLYQTFYPNGSIYLLRQYHPGSNTIFKTTWYKASGKIDTGAYMDKGKSGYSYDKVGRRLEWWNNGHLKSDENFKANYPDGRQRTWHENGRLQSEKKFKAGIADGITRLWYSNRHLQYYADCRNNASSTPALSFYENGMIKTQENCINSGYDESGHLTYETVRIGNYSRSFEWRNGQQNNNLYKGKFDKMRKGKWIAYDDKGRIIYNVFYKNGLLSGQALFYDTVGRINTKAHFKEGRLHGAYLSMNDNGTDTFAVGNYLNNQRTGTWRMFSAKGLLLSVQQYTSGNYYDELEKYDEQGTVLISSKYDPVEKVLRFYHYSNGKLSYMNAKHTGSKAVDMYDYYDNGNVKTIRLYDTAGGYTSKGFYENGSRQWDAGFKPGNYAHGKQYRWYPDGQVQMEGVMTDGYKEGEWITYNADGSIASKTYFIKGIEQVTAPAYPNCFCNNPMPEIPGPSFFNPSESFMPFKSINAVMRRFNLDTAYKYTFVRCNYCSPTPIIAVRDQKLWIDKEGMYLDLTPCMHGVNRSLLSIEHTQLTTVKEWYRDYDNETELLQPVTLAQVLERAIAVYERGDDYMNYQQVLETVSGDSLLLYHLLKKNYGVTVNAGRLDEDNEKEAMEQALEQYKKTDHGRIFFKRHFSAVLAKAVLPFFSAEAKVLATDSTNRQATVNIFRKLFATRYPEEVEERLFGSLDVVLDSGTAALNLPPSFIATCDTVTGKKILPEGKPVAAPFVINFGKAYYHSYPADNFTIRATDASGYCAPAFTISNTGVWIQPQSFRYALGKAAGGSNNYEEEPFTVFNYPAHYKNFKMMQEDMNRHAEAELDEYIQHFMGVVIKKGTMHLPGLQEKIPVSEVIADAKEINGCIKVPQTALGITESSLKEALIAAGFSVFNRQQEWDNYNQPMVILYFHRREN